jgi:hypothetical protein
MFGIDQTLMSGSVWTSSANGALNLLLLSYLTLRTKYQTCGSRELAGHFHEFRGCVEGDDGIAPDEHTEYTSELIKQLGLKLKLEKHKNYTTASFCGIVKPSQDVDTICTDPTKIICDIFVLDSQYKNATQNKQLGLLRAKALSLLYQYQDCPIISPLCSAILAKTVGKSCDATRLDYYHRQVYDEAVRAKRFYHTLPAISDQTRYFVEEHYGYSVEWQRRFELAIEKWKFGEEVVLPTHPNLETYQDTGALFLSDREEVDVTNLTMLPSFDKVFGGHEDEVYVPFSKTHTNQKDLLRPRVMISDTTRSRHAELHQPNPLQV